MKVWSASYFDSNLNALRPTEIIGVKTIKEFDPKENDIAVFLGGEDISPTLYGHRLSLNGVGTTHQRERPPSYRDVLEMQMVYHCIHHGIKMVGFCRGAQLLCIAAGGTLVQHVSNHNGTNHPLILDTGRVLQCNSVHHQMMRLKGVEHTLLGWTPPISKEYQVDPVDPITAGEFSSCEPEIAFFPLIRGIGFQFHPEYDFTSDFGRVALKYIDQYILGR